MKKTAPLYVSLFAAAAVCAGAAAPVWAEEAVHEVKPNDTLGAIVAGQYPDYKNRAPIMQEILKRNPDAFLNNNINLLVVGKTLRLPEAADIPGLLPPEPKAVAGVDPAVQEKLKKLEAENAELKDTIGLMEEENTSLQEMVKQYEEQKQAQAATTAKVGESGGAAPAGTTPVQAVGVEGQEQTPPAVKSEAAGVEGAASEATPPEAVGAAVEGAVPETTGAESGPTVDAGKLTELQQSVESLQTEKGDLQAQLDAARQDSEQDKRQITALNDQLTGLQRANDKFSEELQAVKTAAGSGGRLPWMLTALLALLVLPLLWLLMRRREEPVRVASTQPVAARAEVAPVAETPAVAGGAVAAQIPPEIAANDAVAVETQRPENPEADLKLDIARAYLDLRDAPSAAEILQEVLGEGGNRQRQEAREILSFIA